MLAVVSPAERLPALDMAALANHRMADNLAAILNWVRTSATDIREKPRASSGEDAFLLIEELGGRLDSVIRIHRLLAQRPDATIEIADYLRDIVEGVIASRALAGATELQFAADPHCPVSPERALSLGLIVGELAANSVKFAHPSGVAGKIVLECHVGAGGGIVLMMADDGVGLAEGVDPMRHGHFGLRLIRAQAEQLGARIAFHSDALGLSFRLWMPTS